MLCGYNASRRALVEMMRAAEGRGAEPEAGERVIVLSNDAATGLMNGQQLTIDEVTADNEMILLDEDGAEVDIEVADDAFERTAPTARPVPGVVRLTWAAAITVHKAQGSEWNSVIVLDEPIGPTHTPWRYTAATRARHHVYWTRPALIEDTGRQRSSAACVA